MTDLTTVLTDLRAGLGVEDIARRHRMPVDYIRNIVARLRAAGVIAEEGAQ